VFSIPWKIQAIATEVCYKGNEYANVYNRVYVPERITKNIWSTMERITLVEMLF